MNNMDMMCNQPITYRMQALAARAGMYPYMERAWQERLPQIDRQIIDFYRGTTEIGKGIPQLEYGIMDWLHGQALDGPTRAELLQLGQDPDYMRSRVAERIEELRSAGKLGNPALSPLVSPRLQRHKLELAATKPASTRTRTSNQRY
jgi:hypothetical protein